jgi:hypothetical protein
MFTISATGETRYKVLADKADIKAAPVLLASHPPFFDLYSTGNWARVQRTPNHKATLLLNALKCPPPNTQAGDHSYICGDVVLVGLTNRHFPIELGHAFNMLNFIPDWDSASGYKALKALSEI